jgi:hypothetical protein
MALAIFPMAWAPKRSRSLAANFFRDVVNIGQNVGTLGGRLVPLTAM